VVGGGFSIPVVMKPKRRGRVDIQASLDEGNRGGMGGASLPLHPSTGGRRSAARVEAAHRGAVVATPQEGDDTEDDGPKLGQNVAGTCAGSREERRRPQGVG
jgi:hypothetical protein